MVVLRARRKDKTSQTRNLRQVTRVANLVGDIHFWRVSVPHTAVALLWYVNCARMTCPSLFHVSFFAPEIGDVLLPPLGVGFCVFLAILVRYPAGEIL